MSMSLVGIVLGVLCVVLIWVWTRRAAGRSHAVLSGANRHGASMPGRWSIVLRLEGEDAAFAHSVLARGDASDEERVVDFVRLVPSATHFYAGEWTPRVRNDLPGGVLLRADVSHKIGAKKDLGEVLLFLRQLGSNANLELSIASSDPEGQPLRAVDETKRPGHRQCQYCRQSFQINELECPSCGAAVKGRDG